MPGMAAKVVITERQQQVLQTMAFSRSCPQGLAHRAEVILLAFEGLKNETIAEKLNCERHGIGIWRRRWQNAFQQLTVLECLEKPPVLREAIAEVLGDLPRAGCGGKFTAEQIAHIIAVACEPPDKSGRPVSHWTPRELADEVIKRGIVTSISVRHVGRFLKDGGTSAHKSRYWLNANPKDVAVFEQQVRDVCETYREAPQRLNDEGIHTVCVDEKTGMQALEPKAPTKPMKPGQVERREAEYTRHGTQTLIGNFEVATGEVIAPTVQQTRDEADFAAHIEQTIATDPTAGWIFVLDNLTTHCSATLVLLVAAACAVPAETLGVKGKSGVLKSVATRKKFLSDAAHRVRFVYVPKHTSWMNQIEIWFSVLQRRVIRRGVFRSTTDLRERILMFITYYNQTSAKPYKWTYAGRPLNV